MKIEKPSTADLNGVLKNVLRGFISKMDITQANKNALYEELGNNFHDPRIEFPEEFIEAAYKWIIHDVQTKLTDKLELWKQVVVENAKHNNTPWEVANKVVEEYEKVSKVEYIDEAPRKPPRAVI